MRTLTEKQQKEQRIFELSNLKYCVIGEINRLKVIRRKEMDKECNFIFSKNPDWKLIAEINERISDLQKTVDALLEYIDMIESTIEKTNGEV